MLTSHFHSIILSIIYHHLSSDGDSLDIPIVRIISNGGWLWLSVRTLRLRRLFSIAKDMSSFGSSCG